MSQEVCLPSVEDDLELRRDVSRDITWYHDISTN